MMLDGLFPVVVKLRNGKVFVDALIFAQPDADAVRFVDNNLVDRPDDWDMNSDDSAIEVVNREGTVVFQLVYEDRKSVLVRGLFIVKTQALVADDQFFRAVPSSQVASIPYRVEKLFKYPSSKNRGVRVN